MNSIISTAIVISLNLILISEFSTTGCRKREDRMVARLREEMFVDLVEMSLVQKDERNDRRRSWEDGIFESSDAREEMRSESGLSRFEENEAENSGNIADGMSESDRWARRDFKA